MAASKSDKQLSLPEPAWAIAGVLLGWCILILQVRHHWGGESYYNFGWFVPPLAVWLLLRNLSKSESAGLPAYRSTALFVVLSIILFLPVLVAHALSEVNPFWRVPLWVQGCGLSCFTLILLYRYYGWSGIRSGIFPIIFLTTMIPWPYRVELWIVQSLTEVVIGLAVQGLHFLSYPVEMAGNSLTLGETRIGVNEACSGIRSLQALFMVTLFLGSLFGQTAMRRLLALAALPLIVIIVNTARAMFLSTQVIVNGQDAYDAWHDPAGYIAFGVSMVLIYAAIELLNIGGADSNQSQAVNLKSLANQWSGRQASISSIGYFLIPLITFLTVEGWFRYHEMKAPAPLGWELQLPDPEDPEYRYVDINKHVETALGYSYGHRFFHGLSDDSYVEVYYYGYGEDNKLSSVSSYGHAPTICMEASGASLLREFPPAIIELNSLRIPVRHYLFELPGRSESLHVFWTIWENRNMNISPEDLQELNYSTQWIQLRKGRRDFSRQVLLASLAGIEDPSEAREEIERLLGDWINRSED